MSVNKPVDLLAEAREDPRLGNADGVGREIQLGSGFTGRALLEHHDLEGPPGGRLELTLDHLQQPAKDVAVVFIVPQSAQIAGGIFELIERLFRFGGECLRPANAPETAQVIDGDGTQPAAESAAAKIMRNDGLS